MTRNLPSATMPLLKQPLKPDRKSRAPKVVPGVIREDSDDELGDDDHPWEWIFSDEDAADNDGATDGRKRKRAVAETTIVGARMGDFECFLGDTVLLKAEGSNEAWVGIICEFIDDDGDDGEKAAHFMWFSTEKEIRNKVKKRSDYMPVRSVLVLHLGQFRT